MPGIFDAKYGQRKGQKEGGIHAPDPDGGIYKAGDTTYLIKRDTKKPQNDISEFMASSIFNATAPGYGAKIELAKNTSEEAKGQNGFLASEYFKNYKDFFKEAGYDERPTAKETKQASLGQKQYVKDKLLEKNDDGSYKFKGYEQSVVTSLLLGDYSVHSGNMGVITNPKTNEKNLVRIDFGAASRKKTFKNQINPFKSIKNRIGLEKNYFLRDHPRERMENKAFVEELQKVSKIDLTPTIDEKWTQIVNNFDKEAIKKFGKQIGVKKNDLTVNGVKAHYANILTERQKSLKNMATELEIKIAMNFVGSKELKTEKIEEAIKKAVKENPEHCAKIFKNPKKSELGTKYPKKIRKIFKAELNNAQKNEQRDRPVEKETKQPSLASSDNIVLQPKVETPAQAITPENKTATPQAEKSDKPKEIDPILTHVREAISDKQAKIIQEAAKGSTQPEEQVLKHTEVKKQLHEASVSAFKEFHEKFKDDLKPVTWAPSPKDENIKSQIIKNAQGEELCSIQEKTVKSPQSFTLSDGTTKEVSTHRIVEFPKSMKPDSGPMHVSMALKDSNGQNMNKDDAVYFTAHYDKSGKLVEITTPQPIKFNENDKNSPGYIEHNGEIYTIPVTKDGYDRMMKEVSINKQQEKPKILSEDLAVVQPTVESKQQKTTDAPNLDEQKVRTPKPLPLTPEEKRLGIGLKDELKRIHNVLHQNHPELSTNKQRPRANSLPLPPKPAKDKTGQSMG